MQAITTLTSLDENLAEVFAPPSKLESDWFGALLFEPVRYWLFLSPNSIAMAGSLPLWPGQSEQKQDTPKPDSEGRLAQKPKVVEGLWKTGALELFLKDDYSDAYVELHLGPDGSCWAGYFPQTRKKDQNWCPAAELIKLSWLSFAGRHFPCVHFSRQDLPINCSFSAKSRGAVCAMWEQDGTYQYVSCFADRSEPVDFHQPHRFLPFELRPR